MLGSNVSQVGGFKTAFKVAEQWSCDCIQVYLTPSRTWKVQELLSERIEMFKKLKNESKIAEIVSHVPFLVNIASCDKNILRFSRYRLIQEIKIAELLDIEKIVLHPGSFQKSDKDIGLSRVISSLNEVMDNFQELRVKINLETMCGQGSMLCSNFEEIHYILDNLKYPANFGVCFDTAHVFISGYDMRGYEGYGKIINKFDEIVGIDKIGVIHLNDSLTELGSHNDRHACVGEGKMGIQVFQAMLKDVRFDNIPMILEIPQRDEKTEGSLKFLRELKNENKVIEVSKHKNTLF